MNKNVIITTAIIILAMIIIAAVVCLIFLNTSKNNENKLIGGQKDSHGCLAPAGYSWNSTENVCVREWLNTSDPDRYQVPRNQTDSNSVICTQEAKLCSDGSYVSRTGPNCEFTPCPKSCNIYDVIFKFSNSSADQHVLGYDADFILKCSYNSQEIYYFGTGCCDRTTSIYNQTCDLQGSEGGFVAQTIGEFRQISENMKNCSILWYLPDEENRSLFYANSVINGTK